MSRFYYKLFCWPFDGEEKTGKRVRLESDIILLFIVMNFDYIDVENSQPTVLC